MLMTEKESSINSWSYSPTWKINEEECLREETTREGPPRIGLHKVSTNMKCDSYGELTRKAENRDKWRSTVTSMQALIEESCLITFNSCVLIASFSSYFLIPRYIFLTESNITKWIFRKPVPHQTGFVPEKWPRYLVNFTSSYLLYLQIQMFPIIVPSY